MYIVFVLCLLAILVIFHFEFEVRTLIVQVHGHCIFLSPLDTKETQDIYAKSGFMRLNYYNIRTGETNVCETYRTLYRTFIIEENDNFSCWFFLHIYIYSDFYYC